MQFIDSTGKLVDKDKLPREFGALTFCRSKTVGNSSCKSEQGRSSLASCNKSPAGIIQCDYSTPLKENQRLQTLFISPLNELSSTSFADVQQKQVDCVLHLLHSSGDIISFGWPLFHNIVGAINNSQGKLSLK
ncbi:hypothetical protein OUZ56_019000 [Daphnia magna]|uniref:Mon2/Sec7/BIG1-like HDS domain-containing protein n=1 Tax=Daphnia magna TaxID=35525 RepID=A0ABQ9ZAF2_9CRUS|nr:hypothetical protein OUZ56_019000 [Daphnia magna]